MPAEELHKQHSANTNKWDREQQLKAFSELLKIISGSFHTVLRNTWRIHVFASLLCALQIKNGVYCNNPKRISRYFSDGKRKRKQCFQIQLRANYTRKLSNFPTNILTHPKIIQFIQTIPKLKIFLSKQWLFTKQHEQQCISLQIFKGRLVSGSRSFCRVLFP